MADTRGLPGNGLRSKEGKETQCNCAPCHTDEGYENGAGTTARAEDSGDGRH